MRGQRWTDEMDAELRKFHGERYSCGQIAAKMERGLSRNAVIGRCHRLGLSGKAYVRSAPRVSRPKPVNTPVTRIVRANGNSGHLRVYESVESEVGELRCVEVVPRNVSLIDLGANECRYPYGDGPFVFCGHAQAEASSYCPDHAPLTKAVVRMRMTQEQRLEAQRTYMAGYRASKRAALEAAE